MLVRELFLLAPSIQCMISLHHWGISFFIFLNYIFTLNLLVPICTQGPEQSEILNGRD